MSDDLSAMRGDCEGKELAQGFRPTLCAHNSGWCCAVFEGSKYSVGKIGFNSPSLAVNWKSYHLHQIMISPNIALQGEVVILVFKSKTTSMMHSMIGSWNESGIDWKNEVSEIPSAGSFPSIALNSYGNVFLCYQNGYRYLTFMYGVLTKDKTIEWYQKLDTGEVQGEYPSVVFTNDGKFFIIFKKRVGDSLLLKAGEIKYQYTETASVPHPIPITSNKENEETIRKRPSSSSIQITKDSSNMAPSSSWPRYCVGFTDSDKHSSDSSND